jgi:carboxypeptidase Q
LLRLTLSFFFLAFCGGLFAQDKKGFDFLEDQQALDELFRVALTESSVYPWLGDMCLNIGPRLSGSAQAEQAVDYSFDLMKNLGLDVVKQPVMVPHWERGEAEMAFYKTADGKKGEVNILALGGSIATHKDGFMAPIVEVETWEDLAALGREQIQGKIVFFNEPMDAENIYTFHSYGHCVKHRWAGAVEAAKYGAVGAIVRSLNLRIDAFPHTGSMTYEGAIDSIPAAAISTQDAEILSDLIAQGSDVQLFWSQHCKTFEDAPSFNVIGEIKGSKYPNEVILIGGHLDSWDVGHGAHDDGAGVMQSLAVLELLKKVGYQPEHTIRAVFFMNEENGLRGAKEYASQAEASNQTHIACIESDRGGFTPRGFHVEGNDKKVQRILSLKPVLEKYGLHQLEEGGSGADIKPLLTEENVLIGFVPDSQRYFDHHHSPTDTFDAVNKRELELGMASMAALVYLMDKHGL